MKMLIVVNGSHAQAPDAAMLLRSYLDSQGIESEAIYASDLSLESYLADGGVLNARPAETFDMAVVLGGDGTILRTARILCGGEVPILGINFGHLAFLANVSECGVVAMVGAALAGDVTEERRANMLIDVVLEGDDAQDALVGAPDAQRARDGRTCFALNEISVARGASGRILDFSVDISGIHVASMRGDGVVVSTATGSTAYALSAGGPLVSPGYQGLTVVPLAPHTLRSRSMVTAPGDVVEVALDSDDSRHEVSLFVDGEVLSFDRPIERVVVRRGPNPTILLRYRDESFYARAAKVFY